MSHSPNRSRLLFVAALAMLSLRALTPEGYMPGSPSSGLLFELCPSGMPAEIMQGLAGGGHHHHKHHGDGDAVSGTEQCPIGHMLASAVAADTDSATDLFPVARVFEEAPVASSAVTQAVSYRSRAPPA